MARVRGPRLPGCLALAALFSLAHSQHGKGGAGSCDRLADQGVGLWAGVSTERSAPCPAQGRGQALQARQTVAAALRQYGRWAGGDPWKEGASGLPLAAFRGLPPSQRPPPSVSEASRACFLPPRWPPSHPPPPCSVPGPSASILAAPAGPPCQQGLPGGAAEGQPGMNVNSGDSFGSGGEFEF